MTFPTDAQLLERIEQSRKKLPPNSIKSLRRVSLKVSGLALVPSAAADSAPGAAPLAATSSMRFVVLAKPPRSHGDLPGGSAPRTRAA